MFTRQIEREATIRNKRKLLALRVMYGKKLLDAVNLILNLTWEVADQDRFHVNHAARVWRKVFFEIIFFLHDLSLLDVDRLDNRFGFGAG